MTLASTLADILRAHYSRPPDFVIGDPRDPYLLRWYITPWRGWWEGVEDLRGWRRLVKAFTKRCLPNIYLHCFLRDDDDRALHDHPSWGLSYMLEGAYTEHTIANGGVHERKVYRAGSLRYMGVKHAHRIELFKAQRHAYYAWDEFFSYAIDRQPCWTLFVFGPVVRDWGFHCPERGWVPWWDFVKPGARGERGKGCD